MPSAQRVQPSFGVRVERLAMDPTEDPCHLALPFTHKSVWTNSPANGVAWSSKRTQHSVVREGVFRILHRAMPGGLSPKGANPE